jgi:hypothetical protein
MSGNKEPIIRASLLNSNFFLITGSSKNISGTAMWNSRKILGTPLINHIITGLVELFLVRKIA